jgi:adenine-specific DNA-methyltransferase
MTPTRHTEPIVTQTPDLPAERLTALRELFPDIFTEGKVDSSKLRAAVGDLADDTPERYTFSWAGKRDAIRLLQTPTRATLVPARDESLDFDATQNLFIEGDNLEVLKLLYKPYFGRVKMIYIDPPYNTGNDFVYPDNYADPLATYLQMTGQQDADGNLLASNTETSGRYHSAWLSMMYPRLFLARQLLREDGVIFVSIDDNEVHNLRIAMNEAFGEENFIDCLVWQKKVSPSNDAKWFSSDHDYIVVYARSKEIWRPRRLTRNERQLDYYKNPDNDPRGSWNSATYTCNKSKEQRPNLYYPVVNPNTGEAIWPRETAVWAYSREEHQRHVNEGRLYWGADGRSKIPRLKTFLSEARDVVPRSIWPYSEVGHTQEATQEFMSYFPQGGFDSPKPPRLIEKILRISTEACEQEIVLDFFSGSCTTAQAVFELNQEDGGNRRFIMVQLPEPTGRPDYPTIADIGKERIRRVIARMKGAGDEQPAFDQVHEAGDLGFKVFKLAPSHFKPWVGVAQPTPQQYTDQMALFDDPLVDGWTAAGVIQEIALKEGYGLACQVEKMAAVTGQTVYRVADPQREQSFAICLDDRITLAALTPLQLAKDDRFVCRDRALDDEAAANLALQCRLKTI